MHDGGSSYGTREWKDGLIELKYTSCSVPPVAGPEMRRMCERNVALTPKGNTERGSLDLYVILYNAPTSVMRVGSRPCEQCSLR